MTTYIQKPNAKFIAEALSLKASMRQIILGSKTWELKWEMQWPEDKTRIDAALIADNGKEVLFGYNYYEAIKSCFEIKENETGTA